MQRVVRSSRNVTALAATLDFHSRFTLRRALQQTPNSWIFRSIIDGADFPVGIKLSSHRAYCGAEETQIGIIARYQYRKPGSLVEAADVAPNCRTILRVQSIVQAEPIVVVVCFPETIFATAPKKWTANSVSEKRLPPVAGRRFEQK